MVGIVAAPKPLDKTGRHEAMQTLLSDTVADKRWASHRRIGRSTV